MQGFAERHREDYLRQSANHDVNMLATVSWSDASWRRMVNEFFSREINAHRCLRSNLSRGSVSAMRMLRQEADNLPGPTGTPAQLHDGAETWYADTLSMRPDL